MKDQNKTKTQLNAELEGMRRRVSELEQSETERKRAEEVLRESEDKFKLISEQSLMGIMIIQETTMKYCNDAASSILEFTCEELLTENLGQLIMERCHPDDQSFVIKQMKKKQRGDTEGIVQQYSYRLITSSGKIKCVDQYSKTIFYHNRPADLVTIIDITERKQTEEALRESEERFRTIFQSAPDAVFLIAAEGEDVGRILATNDAAERMHGYLPGDLVGKGIADLDTPEAARMVPERLRRLVAGERLHFEIEHRRIDGTVFPVEVTAVRILLDGRKHVLAFDRDITERKLAEEELRKLSTATEQSPASVVITDPQGNIEYVNPKFCELTGYSAEEVLGKNPRILQSGEMPKETYEQLWKTILAGKTWHGEFHNKKKNDELYWEDAVISAILNDDGDITHFLAVKEDITQRKQAEEEKTHLEKQLRRSQKLETIGTLAGGIAHDFNNILMPIMGYAEMALSSLPSSNPLFEDLEHILEGANRAKDLVEQILLFSRQIEKERMPLTLHLIVKEALKLLRSSIPTTIEIRQRIDSSCDKVSADASQMHQVILNLCTNAYQAMEEKGGTLTIELKQVEVDSATAKLYPNLHEAEYVRLTVRDTGSGMDESTLARIFEPFFTTKSVDKGTGMGLSVVHGVVRSHHGDVLVNSEPGKGSTFHVYLPIIKAELETAKKEPKIIEGGQESILVVDDEEAVAKVIKRMLERLGYKVVVCKSSIEALKAFRQQPDKYDLVISDLTMPDITGLDLSEQLQKLRSEFPIIIMTGYGENVTDNIQKHHDIQQVIGKPIRLRELASAIREVLNK